jgi:hypothetical protein
MIVEPFAHDRLSDNLNPVGRIYYAASTMVCAPASLAQEVGLGLGAQAGELRLRQVVTAAASRPSGAPLKRRSTSSSKRNPRSRRQ